MHGHVCMDGSCAGGEQQGGSVSCHEIYSNGSGGLCFLLVNHSPQPRQYYYCAAWSLSINWISWINPILGLPMTWSSAHFKCPKTVFLMVAYWTTLVKSFAKLPMLRSANKPKQTKYVNNNNSKYKGIWFYIQVPNAMTSTIHKFLVSGPIEMQSSLVLIEHFAILTFL